LSLALALDVKDLQHANLLIEQTKPYLGFIKLGHVALSNIDINQLETKGIPIMLDLKFFDITNTVKEGILGYSKQIKDLSIFTISAACQNETVQASLEFDCKPYFVIHLSSDNNQVDKSLMVKEVERIVKLGGRNFICPPFLIDAFRNSFGNEITLMTPGVRNNSQPNDHSAAIDARTARALGTDHIVVGRPIYNSNQPNKIAKEYYDQFISI